MATDQLFDRQLAGDAPADEPPAARKAPAKKATAKKATGGARPAPLRSPSAGKGGRPPGRPSSAQLRGEIQDGIEKIAGALILAGVANPRLGYDGRIIAGNADKLAAELFGLCEKNASVRSAVEALFRGAGMASSVMLVAGVLLPIAANHGLLPVEVVGLLPGVEAPPPRERKPKAPKAARPAPHADTSPAPAPAEQPTGPAFALGFPPDADAA